ncbi:6881_t:CDS:2, partial [Funneliformis geosporum]
FSSEFAKSQNEDTYVTNVIVSAIRITLKGLPLGRSSYVSIYYEDLLKQLPPSVKKDEQVIGIHSDIEELLTKEVNRYHNKKNRQKIKIEANTSSDGSSTLSRLYGFENQLEEYEYDVLMSRKESEYNNCIIDMKQKLYSFKHQLENQHNSNSADLERRYKSQITTLEKSIVIKDKDIDLKIIALNDKIISYNPH